jgi:ABC-type sugar transport system ATPase subunit
VLSEPTCGVDVGARVGVYTALRELADNGVVIVLYSLSVRSDNSSEGVE